MYLCFQSFFRFCFRAISGINCPLFYIGCCRSTLYVTPFVVSWSCNFINIKKSRTSLICCVQYSIWNIVSWVSILWYDSQLIQSTILILNINTIHTKVSILYTYIILFLCLNFMFWATENLTLFLLLDHARKKINQKGVLYR